MENNIIERAIIGQSIREGKHSVVVGTIGWIAGRVASMLHGEKSGRELYEYYKGLDANVPPAKQFHAAMSKACVWPTRVLATGKAKEWGTRAGLENPDVSRSGRAVLLAADALASMHKAELAKVSKAKAEAAVEDAIDDGANPAEPVVELATPKSLKVKDVKAELITIINKAADMDAAAIIAELTALAARI